MAAVREGIKTSFLKKRMFQLLAKETPVEVYSPSGRLREVV
jgi:hypothetical protein